ncbi:MAG: hypothetical protein ACOC1F_05945 [Myxococcota bacterium]
MAQTEGPFEPIARVLARSSGTFRVVQTVASAQHALNVARKSSPEMLMVGLRAPFRPKLNIVRTLAKLDVNTVVLCEPSDAGWAVEALRAGAVAYILTDTEEDDILRMLRTVSRRCFT